MASDTKGRISLDVGKMPDAADVLAPPEDEGPEPYEILARLYAHLWHRIPLARSVAKKFEGTGNSSGPLADLVSLFFALARRNESVIQAYGTEVAKEFGRAMEENRRTKKEKKAAKRKGENPKSSTSSAEPQTTTPLREVQ